MYKLILLFIAYLFCSTTHAQNFYDVNTVQRIDVYIADTAWNYRMDTAKASAEGYLMADSVLVNGVSFDSVGIKYKGNSSYNVAYNKKPLHINLNTFKEQNYNGVESIKLSNIYKDPSFIREVMGFRILANFINAPQANFAKVYINNNYIGIYTSVENIDKAFVKQHFFSEDQLMVKCNPVNTNNATNKSNLRKLTPHDSTSYTNYYELKSTKQWTPFYQLVDTIGNTFGNSESVVNMDEAIWMLAFNNATVNLDSYSGLYAQNYYLARDNNDVFRPIIWDLNMCFGGFPFAGAGNTNTNTLTNTTMPNMQMYLHGTDTYWPLIQRVIEDSTYKKMYVAHLRYIVNNFLSPTYTAAEINYLRGIVDTLVQVDSNGFFSYTDFLNADSTDINTGTYITPGISNINAGRTAYYNTQPDFTATPPTITFADTNKQIEFNTNSNFKATITNATQAWLYYRFAKDKKFIKIKMYDDGLHSDGAANDNNYGTSILPLGTIVQYYIYAQNSTAGIFAPENAAYNFYTANVKYTTANVVLSEACPNNVSIAKDSLGEYNDWIEIKAFGAMPLGHYYLSDNSANIKKWQFPSDVISFGQPFNLPIVWADEDVYQKGTHTNFKLNDAASTLYLADSAGIIIDTFEWKTTIGPNLTYMLCSGAKGINTSFGTTVSFTYDICFASIQNESIPAVNVYPNPATNNITIESTTAINTITLLDNFGRIIVKQIVPNGITKYTLPLNNITAGMYLLKVNNSVTKVAVY